MQVATLAAKSQLRRLRLAQRCIAIRRAKSGPAKQPLFSGALD